MTNLAHPAPVIRWSATQGSRTASIASRRIVAPVCLAAVLCVIVLGLVVLAIAGIDTGGQLPHPVPLPAPSGPSNGGS